MSPTAKALTKNHAKLTEQVAAHIAADALVKGQYWQPDDSNPMGGRGCFISCLTHCDSPVPAEREFGLPVAVQRIAENIFEDLPADEGAAFFAALPAAVERDGKDLSRVVWGFLAAELRALPPQKGDVKAVVKAVTEGMDLLFAGKPWPAADAAARAARAAHAAAHAAAYAAAYAAADATRAARAAHAAAHAAAYAATHAATHAARAAAYAADAAHIRQRDTLLRLIKEAPMGETA